MMTEKLITRLRVNSSRKYLHDFVSAAAASTSKGGRVLDAGAGDCLYKPLFSDALYESADFCQLDKAYGDITYVCDLTSIPVEEGRYDTVILTQVLEHVPEPKDVLRELCRVLKPGGRLWLSAPAFYAEHEVPYDFYRYTQFGLQYLLESAGFRVTSLEWLEGYYGTLSYQLENAATQLPLRPADFGGGPIGFISALLALVLKPVFLLLSFLFARLDIRSKHVLAGHCKNYAVVAVRERW
jgi:SAM-dependent methyltransferase